jgi:hypothetical protein
MRATWVLASLCAVSTAHAGTRIISMTGAEDASALQVALAGRGDEISILPAPEGALLLDRAASVQRSAVDARAIAGVWIEQGTTSAEVCVVSADGKLFRHAPLPVEAGSPRVFAAIATSLLDELVGPQNEFPDINVDVRVDIGQPGDATRTAPAPVVAAIDPTAYARALAAPGLAVAAAPPESVVRANRIQLEIGPMLSPLTLGFELEGTFPLSEHLRAGALASLGVVFTAEPAVGIMIGGAEIRYVGTGRKHNDIGMFGGAATTIGDMSTHGMITPFVGVRLQRVWERAESGLSFSINPVLAFVDSPSSKVYPALWTSLRWELPI